MKKQYEHFFRLVPAILWVLSMILIGTIAYTHLENLNLLDALYFSVVVISTVGFGDIVPTNLASQIFTTVFVLIGVISIFYLVTELITVILETRLFHLIFLERITGGREMKNHTVLCGYGNVGSMLADQLGAENLLIVDKKEHKVNEAISKGFTGVIGDSTTGDTLENAGIENASRLIVVLDTDPDAVYTILTAKELNEDLQIYARANEQGSLSKMRRAGADYVICLPGVGSREIFKAIEQNQKEEE